jgi:ABC-type polysaccharide/polyol phosphate transport system ATPase subunit
MVFATHNPEVARQLCTKAIFLDHGKLAMYGEIDEVLAFYHHVNNPTIDTNERSAG